MVGAATDARRGHLTVAHFVETRPKPRRNVL
jgi:hypothetical protein